MDLKKELTRITSEYFNDTLDYQKLLVASTEYQNLLNSICDSKIDTDNGRKDIQYNDGKALGTYWAAKCIDDLIRTRKFIRGIDLAVKDKKNQKKTLHILYAGTGPFASLILPIIYKYSKLKIKYTFIETNPLSFKILKNIIKKLDLNEYDIKLVNEDATKYLIDKDNTPDIIISETMQNALEKEQQVSIFYNLMNQTKSDTIFIPEKIEVFIGLKESKIPIEKLEYKHYHKKDKIFDVSKSSVDFLKKIENKTKEKLVFPKKETIIKKDKLLDFNQIVLITEIIVYKKEKIKLNESGLTVPKHLTDISNSHKGSIKINTQYIICNNPSFKIEIIDY